MEVTYLHGLPTGHQAADHIVIQGLHDTVINPEEARKWLVEKGVGTFLFDTYDEAHQVPYEIFVAKIACYTGAA